MLVGNIDQNPTFSRGGVGVRGPKDNEYFYISGLTVINYLQSAVLHGCFETTCTMRYERIRWFNSTRRTFSYASQSGIYWDMDGTLTGYTNGFVSLNYEYMHFPGICSVVDEHVNGVMCGASDGSVRVRRLLVNEQQPWQLDGKLMNVRTSAGFDQVAYDTKKLSGWPVIVLENETFDMRVDDPNDFQELAFLYSTRPYVMESLGYIYNQTTPMDEAIIVHVNFTDWRDHYDADASTALASQKIGPFHASSLRPFLTCSYVSAHFQPHTAQGKRLGLSQYATVRFSAKELCNMSKVSHRQQPQQISNHSAWLGSCRLHRFEV